MIKIKQATIKRAISCVIRNNKRWGKYPLKLESDINRIDSLLEDNSLLGYLHTKKLKVSRAKLEGWAGQSINDIIIYNNTVFLEIIALIEYHNLWNAYKTFFVKPIDDSTVFV